MAVSHQSSTSGNSAATAVGSQAVNMPGTITDGASVLMVSILIGGGSNATLQTPTGWNLIRSDDQSTTTKLAHFWRVADREPANYTFSLASGTQMWSWTSAAYLGCNLVNPIAGSGNTSNATASASITAPAVTPLCIGGLALRIHGGRNTTGVTTQTPPAASTERQDTCNTGSPFLPLTLGETTTQLAEPITATATAVNTASVSSSRNAATIILRPAPTFISPWVDAFYFDDSGGVSGSVATANISTNYPDEYIFAFQSHDTPDAGTISGGGLSWQLAKRQNVSTNAEIWYAKVSGKLTNQTITYNANNAIATVSIVYVTFANCGGIGQVAGASSASGTPTVNITTLQDNSWVWAMFMNQNSNAAVTAGTAQTIAHRLNPTGEEWWSQHQNAITPTNGTTVTMNVTAPTAIGYELAAVEIVPAVITRSLNINQAINRAANY